MPLENPLAESNEFTKGLLKLPRIGFNKLEKNWYFDRFESSQQRLNMSKEIAIKISKSLNKPIGDVQVMLAEMGTDKSAMTALAPFLDEVQVLEESVRRAAVVDASIDMASMILASRLPMDWVAMNQTDLEANYAIDLGHFDLDKLTDLPRSKWLKSADRKKVIDAIVEMLPGSIISEIAEYAQFELNEGPPPKAEPETMAESVGKPQSESPESEVPADS